jgi:arylsulfatase A-like enzyme
VATGAVALARTSEGLVLDLPPSSLPPGSRVEETFALGAPTTQKAGAYGWPLPFDPSLVATPQSGARTFGFYAPPSMALQVDGIAVPFERLATKPGTWGYDAETLWFRPTGATPQPPGHLTVHFPRGAEAERRLHLTTSGLTPQAFALRDVVQGTDAQRGVYLPAPARATWTINVPLGTPMLRFEASILQGALRRHTSDGASVSVTVRTADGEHVVLATPIQPGDRVPVDAPLSAWAGQSIQLSVTTSPGPSPVADRVFLAEPMVVVPSPRPRRIVALFLDTVRRDALGAYGKTTFPATPKIDAWANAAMRFEDARTVAPWTLPSARTALTGAEPEAWSRTQTLPARLAEAGWVTEGLVANAFLSPAFDGHRGFGHYAFHHLQQADKTVDDALGILAAHPDRDVFLWLQFMEAHLPYRAPDRYDGLFAGAPPDSLRELSKARLDRLSPDAPEFPAIRDHVRARYAEQLRFLDDEIARLLAALGPDVTIVIFSDHGEEFWDHGRFEHGHAFGDELLRVPLLLYDPRLPAGAYTGPASLADLAPTLLELAGCSSGAPLGRSLVGPLFGEDVPAFADRVRTFGRPLYGEDGWGYVAGDLKWWTRDGRDREIDLRADPSESTPRDVADAERAAVLSAALGTPVVRAIRVALPQGRDETADEAILRVPGGVREAWPAYDPRALAEGVQIAVQGDTVRASAPADRTLPAAIYLVPQAALRTLQGITVDVKGTHVGSFGPSTGWDAARGRRVAEGARQGEARLELTEAWAVAPFGEAIHTDTQGALHGLLRELGYVDE